MSKDLISLRTRFARFNIFEALGVARRELHHSSFLSFLLDPRESHSLGDLFLRRFLQEVARLASEPVIATIDLDGFDLTRMEVRREYENIDILLVDPVNEIAIVIENKVSTKQHDDQLKRYAALVNQQFPKHSFTGVYLTPGGESAQDSQYVAITYELIRDLVNDVLVRDDVLMTPALRIILEQYTDLLGRRFMADHDLQELCARIYKRHKQAIDILIANIPDEYARALEFMKDLVIKSGYAVESDSDAHALRFVPKEFTTPRFRSEAALRESGQMVYAECKKKGDTLVFQVKLDGGHPKERTEVHSFAVSHKPFHPEKSVYTKYQVLYSQVFLRATDLDQSEEKLKVKLTDEWKRFVGNDLSRMREAASTLFGQQ